MAWSIKFVSDVNTKLEGFTNPSLILQAKNASGYYMMLVIPPIADTVPFFQEERLSITSCPVIINAYAFWSTSIRNSEGAS